jgi:hypothetical protein
MGKRGLKKEIFSISQKKSLIIIAVQGIVGSNNYDRRRESL